MLSLSEAYAEARSGGVCIERPPALRLIRLVGPQRIWFLQNTVTADVEGVEPGRWIESCFLDPKGRVQAHFRVGVLSEEVLLDVEPDAGENLVDWFVRYRFRTKVEIEGRQMSCFTIFGPRGRSLAPDGTVATDEAGILFGGRLGDVDTVDVHTEGRPAIVDDLPLAPVELYDILRIEAGIGAFGIDYGTRDLPQEAGLTRTLAVDKGCYVGQETVARIHFRGHVNRVVRALRFAEEMDERRIGTELTWDGRSVGRVTSVASSPRLGPIGLGMVRVEPPEGAEVDVEGGGRATLGPIPEGTKVKVESGDRTS